MTLRVDPAALNGYASQIGRAAEDATATERYLGDYAIEGGWNGILIYAVGDSHTRSMSAARMTAKRLAVILGASQDGLSLAASYYRRTDSVAAARMDATVPGACVGPPTPLEKEWISSGDASSFHDAREPCRNLTAVGDVNYSHPLAPLDYISVSSWALKGFDAVFGFNPLERVTEYFAGDWQAVASAGVAIGRSAGALHDLGYNVQGGAMTIQRSWQGEAGDAAYAYFTSVANGVEGFVSPLREISGQFSSLAHGVWSACEAINGLAKGLLDAAIIAGIAAAAGTVTAETGIGAVVGYGVAAIEVTRMLDTWAQMTRVMNNIYASVQAGVGFIESQLSQLQGANLSDLPGDSAYRHPLADG